MFKKLKDKIAEEVKQSPLKTVQQLAQAVVLPSSSSVFEPSSSNEKFCIEEGDIEEEEQTKSTPVKPAGGFTSVTLTGQTSSPLRDQNHGFRSSNTSFNTESDNFFPVFESQPSNFNVQSDWESASEVEDRYSQLEHISKESLYEAYRKVFNKYNKMKNKYHELVTHYRQLERERDKAKTVLTETQDKALLRISELREQCLLEQQAKAHLEEALRNELEERDHIINTLRTKVQYLKNVNESATSESLDTSDLPKEEDNLIDFTENSSVSKVPLPLIASDKESVEWLDQQFSKCNQCLLDNLAALESLKQSLEERRKANGLNEDSNLETVISSENLHQNIKDYPSIFTSFTTFMEGLENDVKLLHENTKDTLRLKEADELVNIEKSSFSVTSENIPNKSSRSQESNNKTIGDGDANAATYDQNRIEVCDLQNEIQLHHNTIKELQKDNELLVTKLQDINIVTESLKSEVNATTTILQLIKSQVRAFNEAFESGNYSGIEIILNQPSDDELIQDINYCLTNLSNTRLELEKLNVVKIKLENELTLVKEQLKYNESVKSYEENISRELIDSNDKLREELESLQNENNAKLSEKEMLSNEIIVLKKENVDLKEQFKNVSESLIKSEKLCTDNKETFNQISLNLNEEKILLQNKILNLEQELDQVRKECLQVQESRNELLSDLETLRKENSEIMFKKVEIKQTIDNIKQDFEKSKNDMVKDLEAKANEIAVLKAETYGLVSKLNSVEDNKISKTYENKLLGELNSLSKEIKIITKEKEDFHINISKLEKELEASKLKEMSSSDKVQQMIHEISSLKNEKETLLNENRPLKERLSNINVDQEHLQNNYALLDEDNKRLLNELDLLKKEHGELTAEKVSLLENITKLDASIKENKEELLSYISENNKLKNDMKSLISEFDTKDKENAVINNKLTYLVKNLENTEQNLSLVSQEKNKLFDELNFLKKEYDSLADVLNNTKKELESLYNKETEKIQSENREAEEIKHKVNEELTALTKERDNIIMENKSLNNKIETLSEELTFIKNDLHSVREMKEKFSAEVDELRKEHDLKDKEVKSIKKEFDELSNNYETVKSQYSSESDCKTNLAAELDSLKMTHSETKVLLNDCRQKLQTELERYKELDQNLNHLTETFKVKCVDLDEKCKENNTLKNDVDILNNKVNQMNRLTEVMSKEKNILHNNLLSIMSMVKDIKNVQNCIINVMNQFQRNFFEELRKINAKISNDLTVHVNDVLCENKLYIERISDLEYKTKEAMDSYNSLIKKQQKDFKSSVNKEKRDEEKESDETILNNTGNGLNLNEVGRTVKNHSSQNSCKLSFTNHYDGEQSDNNLTEHKNNWDFQDFDGLDSDNSLSNHENIQQRNVIEKECVKETEKKEFCEKGSILEIQQLLQEIKLKDDLIKKLQYVVEEYEQDKLIKSNSSKLVDTSEQLKNFGSTQENSTTVMVSSNNRICDKNDKFSWLEEENNVLMDQLQKVKKDYEIKLNELITNYETKLEQEREHRDSEGIGKPREKYVVNEMKEQIENLQEDLEVRGDAYEKLYEEHKDAVKSHEEEIKQLRCNYEKEMREQDKKWRHCLDRRLAEEELRHQEELTQLTREWLAERKELETSSRLASSVVESGSTGSELLRRQVQALTVQLHQLQNQRCDSCDQKVFPKERRKSHGSRSIQDCTEMEYLRNILYEYMMGKEPLVLAKVLCALVKFDENQTKDIVLKEEQKITLLGQLRIV